VNIHIIYTKIIDDSGNLTIGGIQRYLLDLAILLSDNNYKVNIYQPSNKKIVYPFKKIHITGKTTNVNDSLKSKIKKVIKSISYSEDDLIIWGSEKISIKLKGVKTLTIQHGVVFDYINYNDKSKVLINPFFGYLYKFFQRIKSVKDFMNSDYQVCVDYNYLNWIRTMIPRSYLKNTYVITNSSEKNLKKNIFDKGNFKTIHILFARRFVDYRGVYLLLEIIEEINRKYKHVEFTIAGEGKLEAEILNKTAKYKNVIVKKYPQDNANEVNRMHHITLIPTYASEGTSLSLLEGMSAGTVPVVSNVGGITNIVLNGFNGLMTDPDSDQFVASIEMLLNDHLLMKKLSKNARITAAMAFSKERWDLEWLKLINMIS